MDFSQGVSVTRIKSMSKHIDHPLEIEAAHDDKVHYLVIKCMKCHKALASFDTEGVEGKEEVQKKSTKVKSIVGQILSVLDASPRYDPYNDLVELIVENFSMPKFLERLGQYLRRKDDKLRR